VQHPLKEHLRLKVHPRLKVLRPPPLLHPKAHPRKEQLRLYLQRKVHLTFALTFA
jgi:hypothetical protein